MHLASGPARRNKSPRSAPVIAHRVYFWRHNQKPGLFADIIQWRPASLWFLAKPVPIIEEREVQRAIGFPWRSPAPCMGRPVAPPRRLCDGLFTPPEKKSVMRGIYRAYIYRFAALFFWTRHQPSKLSMLRFRPIGHGSQFIRVGSETDQHRGDRYGSGPLCYPH